MKSGGQEYTILIIFTNGNVHSVPDTEAALDSVRDEPLSTIVVGVGPSDFKDMAFLNERGKQKEERVTFVDLKAHGQKTLAEETLKAIPEQLEAYFNEKGIKPNPPVETDEIIIEPFNEEEEVQANVVVSDSGDVQVQSDAKPPDNDKPTRAQRLGKQGAQMVMKYGRRTFQKQFGRVNKNFQRQMDRMVTQQVNQVLGIKNTTGNKQNNKYNNNKKKQNNKKQNNKW